MGGGRRSRPCSRSSGMARQHAWSAPCRRTSPGLAAGAGVDLWAALGMAASATALGVVGLVVGEQEHGRPSSSWPSCSWSCSVCWTAIMGPVRQAYINENIPSAQRATVLSFDSFFCRHRRGGGTIGAGLRGPDGLEGRGLHDRGRSSTSSRLRSTTERGEHRTGWRRQVAPEPGRRKAAAPVAGGPASA